VKGAIPCKAIPPRDQIDLEKAQDHPHVVTVSATRSDSEDVVLSHYKAIDGATFDNMVRGYSSCYDAVKRSRHRLEELEGLLTEPLRKSLWNRREWYFRHRLVETLGWLLDPENREALVSRSYRDHWQRAIDSLFTLSMGVSDHSYRPTGGIPPQDYAQDITLPLALWEIAELIVADQVRCDLNPHIVSEDTARRTAERMGHMTPELKEAIERRRVEERRSRQRGEIEDFMLDNPDMADDLYAIYLRLATEAKP
jgi:hypothetical protein